MMRELTRRSRRFRQGEIVLPRDTEGAMKHKKDGARLQTIAFHSASPSIEGTFAAAARSVFGKLTVRQLDGDLDGVTPRALDRALLVMAHPEMPRNVSVLR